MGIGGDLKAAAEEDLWKVKVRIPKGLLMEYPSLVGNNTPTSKEEQPKMTPLVIGLMGAAGVGKDAICAELGMTNVKFASSMKDRMKPLADSLGIDLEDRTQKEKLRRTMEAFAADARAVNPNYAIDYVREKMPVVGAVCFTDLRCLNEAQFVWAQGGVVFHVMRPGHAPREGWEADSIAAVLRYARENYVRLPEVNNASTIAHAAARVRSFIVNRHTHAIGELARLAKA